MNNNINILFEEKDKEYTNTMSDKQIIIDNLNSVIEKNK
jgi:hypothetical protein